MRNNELLLYQAIKKLLTALPMDNTNFSYLNLKKSISFQNGLQTLLIWSMKTPIPSDLKTVLQKNIQNLKTQHLFSNKNTLKSIRNLHHILLIISHQLNTDLSPHKVKLHELLRELQTFCLSYSTPISQITPPTFTAYVVNTKNNNIFVIDTNNNTVMATIPVGTLPTDIALTPDRKFAYVTNSGDQSLSIINTSSIMESKTISLDTNPEYIAIHPNGKTAYVTNSNDTTVSIIDLTTHTVSSFTGAPAPQGIALQPDGSFLYILSLDNNIWVFDTLSYRYTKIPVGPFPRGIAFLKTAALVYITSSHSGTVTIINSNPPSLCRRQSQ
ncbi:YncE family protein [Bacillus cereus]